MALGATIDFETATSHTIEVTATSSDSSTSAQSFTIDVTDDTSEFTVTAVTDTDVSANQVAENATGGTVVGITAFASDADGSDTVTYSLSSNPGGLFQIDPATGIVTVALGATIDFETATSHTIEVTATSSDGSTSAQSFTIGVTDDTSEFTVTAVTDTDVATNQVAENATGGTVVGITAFASDADGSDTVTYSLSSNPGGLFQIDPATGIVTVALGATIDYETATSHTIEVTATSSDSSTSAQSFTIGVTDDTSEFTVTAVTDTDVATNQVAENATGGTVVGITAFASDGDGSDTVTYSLSSNPGGLFQIDPATGVVSVAPGATIDYETATSHTIEVTATSSDSSTSAQSFTIGVTDDTSEFTVTAVTDTDVAVDQVAENATGGTVVGITAFASDADGSDTVTYSLSSNPGGLFQIDPATGVVTVAPSATIDYETATSHTIEVTATSSDSSTSAQSFTIGVTDDTSEFTVTTVTDTDVSANTVAENATGGTVVGITAFASDGDGSDSVTYSLSSNPGGLFQIDPATGVVTVALGAIIDYETATSHTIEVTATSSDNSTSAQSFTIGVTDDTSEFTVTAVTDTDVSANTVAENATASIVVGITAFASDADGSDTVTYSLSSNPGGLFQIDPATGIVTVATGATIDYETATSHTIEVTATSSDSSTSAQSFTIGVTDDTSEFTVTAVTDTDVATDQVAENATGGTVVGITAFASDADGSDTVTYSLSSNPGGLFQIDPATGVVTVAPGATIDFETAASHTIEVTATSSDSSTSAQSFTIGVTDDTSEFTVTAVTDADVATDQVAENATGGTVVGITAFASDADGSDTVTYSLSSNPGGLFQIDPATGVVTVALGATIDYETATSHTIEVTATSSDSSTSAQSFTIGVTDDTSEFTVTAVTDTDVSANQVAENATGGTVVGITAFASDADGSDTVTYSLSSNPGGLFQIDPATGVVTVASGATIDFETATSHTIEVTATSSDSSTSAQSFTIGVTDDTSEFTVTAVTDTDVGTNTVAENATGGTVVGITAFASDADGSDTVTYSLSSNPGGLFQIDPATGVVTVAPGATIDYETATSHTIEVTATSSDSSTSTQSFTIGVTDDISEFTVTAVTDTDAGTNQVAENATGGTVVGITAFASDADGSDTVTYSLSSNPGGLFQIDPATGVVSVAPGATIDYETATSHTIEVTATSSDSSTSAQSFTIGVTDDTSEFTVTAVTDTDVATDQVAENATGGTVVGITAFASDADGSDTVTYSLSSNPGGLFQIDPATGVVTVATGAIIDYEAATSHTIEVTATSSDSSTSAQSFTIGVADDTSEFTVSAVTDSDAGADTVSESAANGTVVGITALAIDADGTDTVSYTLSDDFGGAFAIDPATGVITVADNTLLDFETNPTPSLTVLATSTDGSTSTQAFTVNLGDASEFAPTDMELWGGGVSLNEGGGNAHYLQADDGGALLGGLTQITVEMQFTVSDPGSNFTPLLSYAVTGEDDELLIGAGPSFLGGDIGIWIKGEAVDTGIPRSMIFDGQPHQIAVTWDSATGEVKFYVDGQLEFSQTGFATGESLAGGGTLILGQEQDSVGGGFRSNQTFSGEYNDVRIFDDVRTDTEIADNAYSDIAASTDGLVANWLMNDLNGGVTTEAVSGNDLTVMTATGGGFSAGTAPTLIAPSVSEAATDGTIVGTVTTIDPDPVDSHTYVLLDDAGGRFAIDSATGEISVANAALIDYESATSHTVTVEVTDSSGFTYSEVFTIAVDDVDDAAMAMSAMAAGSTLIGSLEADTLTGAAGSDTLMGSGGADTLSGAGGTDIIHGGAGADVIDGGANSDTLFGGSGGDTITGGTDAKGDWIDGGAGADTITGSEGGDTIFGGAGDDVIDGLGGDDVIDGGAGADQIDGGSGTDTASYQQSDTAVTVDLAAGTGTGGDAQGDTLTGIENVVGSVNDDTLTGDAGDNVLEGGAGTDVLSGGAGSDTASYAGADAAVTADLSTGGTVGDAAGDTFTGIENLEGSDFGDTLTGDTSDNVLSGGLGSDTLTGGAGDDTLIGGMGTSYGEAVAGMDAVAFWTLDDATGTIAADSVGANDGTYQGDITLGSEGVNGASTAATFEGIVGTSESGYVEVGHSSDFALAQGTVQLWFNANSVMDTQTLVDKSSADGQERFQVSIDNGKLVFLQTNGGVTETVSVTPMGQIANSWHHLAVTFGDGQMRIYLDGQLEGSVASSNTLTGNSDDLSIGARTDSDGLSQDDFGGRIDEIAIHDAVLTQTQLQSLYDGGPDNVVGGGDVLDGGAGTDTASYADSAEAVTVDLDAGTGSGGDAEGDTLINMENLIGSAHDDTLTGDGGDNTLEGGAGSDTLDGGLGTDTASYEGSLSGIFVDLDLGITVGGDAAGDTLTNIENLTGSSEADTLKGDSGANVLDGGAGDDALHGDDGDDRLIGGSGDDVAHGGDGDDIYVFAEGDLGGDQFFGGAGWADAIEVTAADGASGPIDGPWTVEIDGGATTVVTDASGVLNLTADSAGTITLADGSELVFEGVDRITW